MTQALKRVRDLMISLEQYAIVEEQATLLDALYALDRAQSHVRNNGHQHRAVLVRSHGGRIVGKIGHLAFLRALRTVHDDPRGEDRLRRAGVDQEMIRRSEGFYRLLSEDVTDLCGKARTIKAREAMRPVSERIGVDESLMDALDAFERWQTLSLLVTDNGSAVGILRAVDLFDEIATTMKRCAQGEK